MAANLLGKDCWRRWRMVSRSSLTCRFMLLTLWYLMECWDSPVGAPLINSPGLITMAWIFRLRQHILARRWSTWWRNVVLASGAYWRRGSQIIINKQKDGSCPERTYVLAWHWHSSPTRHQPCAPAPFVLPVCFVTVSFLYLFQAHGIDWRSVQSTAVNLRQASSWVQSSSDLIRSLLWCM
jgi:hypothetical protein